MCSFRTNLVIMDVTAISSEQQSTCLDQWKSSTDSVTISGNEYQVDCLSINEKLVQWPVESTVAELAEKGCLSPLLDLFPSLTFSFTKFPILRLSIYSNF